MIRILAAIALMLLISQNCSEFSNKVSPTSEPNTPGVTFDTPPITQPNILIIMLDDAGYEDYTRFDSDPTSEFSDDNFTRPNMKAFTQESKRIEQNYSAPMCTPTRISMLSGQFPLYYGIQWVCGANAVYGIPASDPTLPQSLKSLGYFTGTIGKWHSGRGDDQYEAYRKFDYSAISSGPVANGYMNPKYYINDPVNFITATGKHAVDETANYVIQFLEDRSQSSDSKPFYLNYWLNAPHSPHQPSNKWINHYCPDNPDSCPKRERYKALLSQADESIGRVLEKLDELGLKENTIVMLLSDNGGTQKTHDGIGNGPIRGYKTDVFEGGIRSPLFIRWPKVITDLSTDNESLTNVADFLPTFVELAGGTPPSEIAGESFAQTLLTGSPHNRKQPLFWSHKTSNENVDTTEGNVHVSYAVRDGDWKLVYEPLDREEPYLFNLAESISEVDANDKSVSNATKLSELEDKYFDWMLATSAIPLTIEAPGAGVNISGQTYTLSDQGGNFSVTNHPGFNITRLDFTFMTRFISSTRNNSKRMIAMREGSWELFINSDNEIELNTFNKSNVRQIVNTNTDIKINNTYDIAFSIYGFKSMKSVVHISVRDVTGGDRFFTYVISLGTDEQHREIPRLQDNSNSLRFGSSPDSSNPFVGTLQNIQTYRAPLTKKQIRIQMNRSLNN